jgi:hypothetical protein
MFNIYKIKEPGLASKRDVTKQQAYPRALSKSLMAPYPAFCEHLEMPSHVAQALNYADYLMGIKKESPLLNPDAVDLVTSQKPQEEAGVATAREIKKYKKAQRKDVLSTISDMILNEKLSDETLNTLYKKVDKALKKYPLTVFANMDERAIIELFKNE